MPLDVQSMLSTRAAELTAALESADAATILAAALAEAGETAFVSSFGAESVVLLHLLSEQAPGTPVLFLETGMLFAQTLAYQRAVAAALGLSDVRLLRPDPTDLIRHDPRGDLNAREPDACCDIRKVAPLERALRAFDIEVTGRKRHQTGPRAAMAVVEVDGPRLRFNPLARWSPADIAARMDARDLPRHPLVARGFASIGCAPCTSRVAPGEDARAGRWRGRAKTECGIHFTGGRAVPAGA